MELYFVPQNIVFYQLLQLQFPLEYRETRLSKPSKSLLTFTQNNYDTIYSTSTSTTISHNLSPLKTPTSSELPEILPAPHNYYMHIDMNSTPSIDLPPMPHKKTEIKSINAFSKSMINLDEQ